MGADSGPASAGEDLELLVAELARKGWGAGRLQALRARWEAVCGRGGRSLPESASEPEVTYRVDPDDAPPPAEINCAERLHLCKAVCCRLNFALTPSEVRSGKIRWDPDHPYFISHEPDGYCSHYETGTGHCSIYADRPKLCRRYDCSRDGRVWKDFENMVPNEEWIQENLSNPNRVVLRTPLPLMEVR
jgi:Fe-S-cluster containining protein